MKTAVSIIFLLASGFAFSQENTSDYYADLRDRFALRFYGTTKHNKFEFINHEADQRIVYNPNEQFNIGLGFHYKWMSLGIAFNPGFKNDDHIFGKTEKLDVQLNTYMRKWLFDGHFIFYKGFFRGETDDYKDLPNAASLVPRRPDITTFSFGFGGTHTFNHEKFSYKAAFSMNEWQKKSAGSFLLGGYFSLYSLEADSILIPARVDSLFPRLSKIHNLGSLDLGLSFGYAHTFVLKEHYFASLSVIPGISLQYLATQAANEPEPQGNGHLSSKTQLRLSLGYNSEKWYYGLLSVFDNLVLKNSEQTEFNYSFGNFKIFVGRRF